MNITTDSTLSFFDSGEHTIKIVASFVSGREQVYVDEILVSEKRTFRYSSVHTFQIDQQAAEIRVRVVSIFKGPYIIEFWLAGELIDSDEWDFPRIMAQLKNAQQQMPLWKKLRMFFVFGICGGVVGALVGFATATLFKG